MEYNEIQHVMQDSGKKYVKRRASPHIFDVVDRFRGEAVGGPREVFVTGPSPVADYLESPAYDYGARQAYVVMSALVQMG